MRRNAYPVRAPVSGRDRLPFARDAAPVSGVPADPAEPLNSGQERRHGSAPAALATTPGRLIRQAQVLREGNR
jgi:hypothetical protein